MFRLLHWHRLPLALALQPHFQHPLPTLPNLEIVNFAAGNPIPIPPFPQQNWTVLHAGANQVVVLDRIPAPLADVGAPPSDPLCDNDEDAVNLLRGSSNPPHCPHDLWLVLDLGDGRHGHNEDLGAWKNYDRFTLRVFWLASMSIELHRPIVSSAAAPSSSARTDTMELRRLHLARIRLEQEGISVPGTRQREDRVPLVVLLEPLILGGWVSVLPTGVTLLLLGIVGCSVLRHMYEMMMLWEAMESTRRELVLLGEGEGKERVD